MGVFQAVHHRAFHLAQVKSDTRITQPPVNRLQTFQRAGVDVVYRRALQHDVLGLRVLSHHIIDPVFQHPRVGEIQTAIDTQAHQPGAGANLMSQHIAKVLGAWHQAYFGHVRPAGAV